MTKGRSVILSVSEESLGYLARDPSGFTLRMTKG